MRAAAWVAALVACTEPPERSFVDDVRALPDGSALVMRHGSKRTLSRLARDGTILWSHRLARTPDVVMEWGTHVVDDVVALRTIDRDGRIFVEGFSLDGNTRWETLLTTVAPGSHPHAAAHPLSGIAQEGVFYWFAPLELVAVDAKTGRQLARTATRRDVIDVQVSRGALLLDVAPDVTQRVRLVGDRFESLDVPRECGAEDWRLEGVGGRYVELVTSDGRRPIDATWPVEHCAGYRDRIVIVTTAVPTGVELGIFERDGALVAKHTLGSQLRQFPKVERDALPRFLPLLVHDFDAQERTLFMLDLERASVAWQARLQGPIDVFRHGKYWYFSDHRLGVVDGDTGMLVTARRLRAGFVPRQISQSNVAGDSLWLVGHGWDSDLKRQIARLDAVTLAHRAGGVVEELDASNEPPFDVMSRR